MTYVTCKPNTVPLPGFVHPRLPPVTCPRSCTMSLPTIKIEKSFSVHKVSCDHTNVCEVSFYCFNINFVSYFTLILDNLLCKTAGRRRFSSVSRFVSVEEGLCLCADGELGGVSIGSKSIEIDPTKLICFKSLLFCFPIPA